MKLSRYCGASGAIALSAICGIASAQSDVNPAPTADATVPEEPQAPPRAEHGAFDPLNTSSAAELPPLSLAYPYAISALSGASLVIFGHSHIEDSAAGYLNLGSFAYAGVAGRPYAVIHDARAERRHARS
jgi:hypothetical protein